MERTKMKILALQSMVLVGLPYHVEAQQGNVDKPLNVLFIAVDDLSCDMNTFGNKDVKTPNLDCLAQKGMAFSHAYNQAPISGPSRASIMTGYRPCKTQVHDLFTHFRTALPNAVTIPQMFKNNGYFTCRVGKIYHARVPGDIGRPGADDPASWTETYNPIGKDKTDEHKVTIVSKDTVSLGAALAYMSTEGSDDELTDGISANMALKILRERYGDGNSFISKGKEQPFFMAVGFYRPHCPYVAPQKYFDMYPLDSIKLPKYSANDWDNKPNAAKTSEKLFWGLNEQESKKIIQAYYACVSFIDAQVGKLIDGLEEMGLLSNTIIVFWSDHGYMLTHHGQWHKQTLFEHNAKQPLLIYVPGITKGKGCEKIVEMIDLYPTLAELSGLTPPADLDGKSLVPLLKKPEMEWNYPAFTQQARTIFNPNAQYPYWTYPILRRPDGRETDPSKTIFGCSIRIERYRYTEWDEGKQGEELYDYETDPDEFINRANDPEYQKIKKELISKLHSMKIK